MEFTFFIKGIIAGAIIGVPVGPLGAVVIQHVLTKGKRYGFVSGFGSALADVLFGCIVAFGLTYISDFFIVHKQIIQVAGGIFISLVGIKVFFSKPSENSVNINNKNGFFKTFVSSFILSVTNPATIIAFAALLTSFGLPRHHSYMSSLTLVLGIFVGAFLWWIILIFGVSYIKNKLALGNSKQMNKIFGAGIFTIGLLLLLKIYIMKT